MRLRLGLGLGRKLYYLYHKFRTWEPVWLFLNRHARKEWKRMKVVLDNEQKRIYEDLSRSGLAVTSMSALGFSDLFEEMKKFTEKRLSDPEVIAEREAKKNITSPKRGDKPHWVFLMGGGKWAGELDRNNPFVKFSLSRKVTNIVGNYFKLKPSFNSLYLTATMIMPKGMKPILSQLWHRDPEDKKMVRVFVCVNDIDESTGPFMTVLGSQYGGKWGRVFPQAPSYGTYIPDEEVNRIIPKENIKVCTAPAGTVVFCDTAGIHKGGYSTHKSRLLSLSAFTSPASRWPKNYEVGYEVTA